MLIELELAGDVQLRRELLRFRGAVADASPAFEQIARGSSGLKGVYSLRGIERRQFQSQGAFASAGWAPLAPSTVRAKARRGLDPRILHATGRLAASLSGGAGRVEIVSSSQLIFGTSVPYARFHQSGTARMPRRRPIELREQDRRAIVRTLQRYLVGATLR
jgi:phage gpG-like protein